MHRPKLLLQADAANFPSRHIPKQWLVAIPLLQAVVYFAHRPSGSSRFFHAKNPNEWQATGTKRSHVRARNNHAQRSPHDTEAGRYQAFRAISGRGGGNGSQRRGAPCARSVPAWCSSPGYSPSSGCALQPERCQPCATIRSRSGRDTTTGAACGAACLVSAASICGFMASARNSTTGTTTALPNCR